MNKSISIKTESLQQDNIFVNVELKSLEELTSLPVRDRFKNAVVSEGTIVNLVSDRYALLDNCELFTQIEEKLIHSDIEYQTRSINKNNRSFAVDYIFPASAKLIGGKDKIQPLLRFVNSYDGTCKTSGTFGLFRQVCSNGLHIAESEVSFSMRHTKGNAKLIMPKIEDLIHEYMNTEYAVLSSKINHMTETKISDIQKFVEAICDKTKVFSYYTGKKEEKVSEYADKVIATILNESSILDEQPNLWLGYNAFNEVLHSELAGTFDKKQEIDSQLFNLALSWS